MCSKLTWEYPGRSVISIKLLCNFIEIILQHECSVNLRHIFRTLFIGTPFKVCFRYLKTLTEKTHKIVQNSSRNLVTCFIEMFYLLKNFNIFYSKIQTRLNILLLLLFFATSKSKRGRRFWKCKNSFKIVTRITMKLLLVLIWLFLLCIFLAITAKLVFNLIN